MTYPKDVPDARRLLACCGADEIFNADGTVTFGDTRAFYNKRFLPAMQVWPRQAVCHAPGSLQTLHSATVNNQ